MWRSPQFPTADLVTFTFLQCLSSIKSPMNWNFLKLVSVSRVLDKRFGISYDTAQKMKFSITDFFCKCDQIRSCLQIWLHLLKKSLTESFIFLCSMSKSQINFDFLSSVVLWKPLFLSYSPSCNLTPPVSQVLIGQHLIFCSLTSSPCCNSPRKCTPVKYKEMQKAGFPTVT